MIDKIQEEIIDEFELYDDWLDKYTYLIDVGNGLTGFDPEHKNNQYLVAGCQSKMWIDAELRDGRVYYTADSEAIITKGMVALLLRVFNGLTPQEILDADLYFIDRIGLRTNLSPTRSNGLTSMIKQIKMFALAFARKV